MTSPSRKKLRTTRPNTRLGNSRSPRTSTRVGLLGLLLAAGMATSSPADDNPFEQGNPFERPSERSGPTLERPAPRPLDPLEKLERRSAQERWQRRSEAMEESVQRSPGFDVHRFGRPTADDGEAEFDPLGDYERAEPLLEDPLSVTLPALPQPVEPSPNDMQRPVRSPSELKRITEILPFYDYEPDPKVRDEDPCRYLCPRPTGEPCKPLAEGAKGFECPEEIWLSSAEYTGRQIDGTVFHWEASNIRYNPLYFEDVALERYGHTHHELVQPFVSVGKMGAQLLTLPYQMTIDPIHKCIYPLGYYRPGECAPYKHYQPPLNCEAGFVQAGFMTGMFFLIP